MKTWHKPVLFECTWEFLYWLGGPPLAEMVRNGELDICMLGIIERTLPGAIAREIIGVPLLGANEVPISNDHPY